MVEILYTNGNRESILPSQLTLDFMQKIVGGYIEVFHLPPFHANDPDQEIFVVNEAGLLQHLPINTVANEIYADRIKKHHIKPNTLLYTPRFVGNIIICLQKYLDT